MTRLEADIALEQGGFALRARFAAPADGVTALFGPSGGGKSTLLAALAGLKRVTGRIALGARVVADSKAGLHVPAERRGFGLVFQEARLFPHLTARRNIEYAARRAPAFAKLRPDDVAEFFQVAHLLDRPVGNLSGGEKSRVALARALVSAPDYLLLDEPFAALDGARRRGFIAVLLAAHKRFSIPMMVVTHSIDDASALASHLVALEAGRVVGHGDFARMALTPEFQRLLSPHDIGVALPAAALNRGSPGEAGEGVWLRADHVLVAAKRPEAISARNILESRIAFLRPETENAVLAGLETQTGMILARITPEAVAALSLAPGQTAWALIKSHAL